MQVYLENEEHYVSFKDSEGDIIYDIMKKELCEAIDNQEGHISKWIYELAPKNWATRELLMGLMYIIIDECPNCDIDWASTQDFMDFYL
jgi:hypothetical protein